MSDTNSGVFIMLYFGKISPLHYQFYKTLKIAIKKKTLGKLILKPISDVYIEIFRCLLKQYASAKMSVSIEIKKKASSLLT